MTDDFEGRCFDCGSAPQWKHSVNHYCRRCNEKNGHEYASKVVLDIDKLDAYLGAEAAEKLKAECAYDW